MKFQPAIDMNLETLKQLEEGTLRLQVGQWVRFGTTLSRYVGRTPAGALWMEHSRHPSKTVYEPARFQALLDAYRQLWATHTIKEILKAAA